MEEESDLTLVERWEAGDAAAGEALVRRHFASIYGFIRSKVEQEAKDLAQATFLASVQGRERFRGDDFS